VVPVRYIETVDDAAALFAVNREVVEGSSA
jgi:hypothetical protein